VANLPAQRQSRYWCQGFVKVRVQLLRPSTSFRCTMKKRGVGFLAIYQAWFFIVRLLSFAAHSLGSFVPLPTLAYWLQWSPRLRLLVNQFLLGICDTKETRGEYPQTACACIQSSIYLPGKVVSPQTRSPLMLVVAPGSSHTFLPGGVPGPYVPRYR
jgi:hypothetical protein